MRETNSWVSMQPSTLLKEYVGIGPSNSGPFRENEDADYDLACGACETTIVLEFSDHKKICEVGLAYDKRSNGSHGLALLGDVALDVGVRLCVGDRLEPSKSLPDVNAFLDLAVFPRQVTFWRPAAETLSRHRNPLFQIVGVTPPRSLTVDWMHSLNLGVLLQFTKEALWFCIDNGVWGQDGTIDEIVEKATQLIRFDLRAWYKQRHKMFPSEGLTRANLTQKMLGDNSNRCCKTKAAETHGVCIFVVEKLRAHQARIGQFAVVLVSAGQELLDMMQYVGGRKAVLTPAEHQRVFDHYMRYLALTDSMDNLWLPKRHVMLHSLRQIPWLGNPKAYANWHDETLNRTLKSACRNTSQHTFEESVLLRLAVLLKGPRPGSRKRKSE